MEIGDLTLAIILVVVFGSFMGIIFYFFVDIPDNNTNNYKVDTEPTEIPHDGFKYGNNDTGEIN
jgi:hypothetical protein